MKKEEHKIKNNVNKLILVINKKCNTYISSNCCNLKKYDNCKNCYIYDSVDDFLDEIDF